MARHPISTSYITPYKSDGVEQVADGTDFGRGSFTLASGTTYYYPLGGQDSPFMSIHAQGDAAIVITSMTVEACDFPESDVDVFDNAAGEWMAKSSSGINATVEGAGYTNTSGVVDTTGGAQGGARWDVFNHGARRTRLAVVVGATGGELRVASWAKE